MRLTRNCWPLLLLACTGLVCAEDVTVTARVALVNGADGGRSHEAVNVVLWLTPASETPDSPAAEAMQRARLAQHNKSFEPHVVVVPVGSVVAFPNHDPFFHNVFSLFEGKRFDLGLYEAGTTQRVKFDRPGVCYIFCNIHPEMSAVVVVVKTNYYAISDRKGKVAIPSVPPGRYLLDLWYERSLPGALKAFPKEVTVSEAGDSIGTIRLVESGELMPSHKNKYGRDYDKSTPAGPLYEQP